MKQLSGDDGPFGTLAEVLTFAAALGYSEGRREALENTGEQIDYDVFQRLGAELLIDMLAATTLDDVAIMSREKEDQRLKLFEEYANGGLAVLQARLSQTDSYLDFLLGMIIEAETADHEQDDPTTVDFDSVVDELTG